MIRVSKSFARTSSRETVLGNHSRQAEQSRVELGLCLGSDQRGANNMVADAHRDDGKRFVVQAEEKGTAFLELERVTRESL